jgi:hypothetical protein
MRIGSDRTSRRTATVVVALLPVTLLAAGCSDDGGSCERGAATVDEALTTFLESAAEGSSTDAEAMLLEGFSVDPAAFELLHGELDGVTVDSLVLTGEEMGSRHAIRVSSPDAGLIGTFEVEEGDDATCAAVVWGEPPAESEPAAGESAAAQ